MTYTADRIGYYKTPEISVKGIVFGNHEWNYANMLVMYENILS
jgi:hypothetical protein